MGGAICRKYCATFEVIEVVALQFETSETQEFRTKTGVLATLVFPARKLGAHW
jgi:hypothetical protein